MIENQILFIFVIVQIQEKKKIGRKILGFFIVDYLILIIFFIFHLLDPKSAKKKKKKKKKHNFQNVHYNYTNFGWWLRTK